MVSSGDQLSVIAICHCFSPTDFHSSVSSFGSHSRAITIGSSVLHQLFSMTKALMPALVSESLSCESSTSPEPPPSVLLKLMVGTLHDQSW
ncbi:hypothetical protein Tco_1438116 [Tanacetum coccineum]